jgi:hypothetical protein
MEITFTLGSSRSLLVNEHVADGDEDCWAASGTMKIFQGPLYPKTVFNYIFHFLFFFIFGVLL